MDLIAVWQKALEYIEEYTEGSIGFKVYIKPAVPLSNDNRIFTISVPISISKNMIELRYRDYIEAALERATGKVLTLKVIISESPVPTDPEDFIQRRMNEPEKIVDLSAVNPNYTFDNFVVGSSNEYAASMAMETAQNPGYKNNPFFIYGRSGLGKTHLMYAIGNKIKELNPDFNILYVTTESFMNEFVDSIKNQTTMDFKKKYRSVDVLLVDDIQFLSNRESTQEEFFHTFNALYALNKQIVITSDRKPAALLTLEERLRTRFSQGLTTDIAVPNYETRLAILRKKAEFHNAFISEEVLSYIADRIKSNIRELEGALLKIISMSQIKHTEVTIDFAEETIKSILPDEKIIKITPDKIIDKVSSFYNVSRKDILSDSKVKTYTFPRQVAMYICHNYTNLKYAQIGTEFGGKDRTTVMHNIKKIESEISKNSNLKSDIDYIINDLETI